MLIHIINVITAHRPNKVFKNIKQQTKDKHDKIENHPFLKSMIDGTLNDEKYAVYLANLLPIYKAVEETFLKSYLNTDLIQSKKIINDIDNYNKLYKKDFFNLHKCNSQWLEHYHMKVSHLKAADLYIRWLADMYGGQILKRNIKFNSKYNFNNLRWSIKTIRTLLEEEINESNCNQFIEEVNLCYDFHRNLVESIQGLDKI